MVRRKGRRGSRAIRDNLISSERLVIFVAIGQQPTRCDLTNASLRRSAICRRGVPLAYRYQTGAAFWCSRSTSASVYWLYACARRLRLAIVRGKLTVVGVRFGARTEAIGGWNNSFFPRQNIMHLFFWVTRRLSRKTTVEVWKHHLRVIPDYEIRSYTLLYSG